MQMKRGELSRGSGWHSSCLDCVAVAVGKIGCVVIIRGTFGWTEVSEQKNGTLILGSRD